MHVKPTFAIGLVAALATASGCGIGPSDTTSNVTHTETVTIYGLDNTEETAVVSFDEETPDHFAATVSYRGEWLSFEYWVDPDGDPDWVDLLGPQTLHVVDLATGNSLHVVTLADDPDVPDVIHPYFSAQLSIDGVVHEFDQGVDVEALAAELPGDPSVYALLMVYELPWLLVSVPDGELLDAGYLQYGSEHRQARGVRNRYKPKPKPTPPPKPPGPKGPPTRTKPSGIKAKVGTGIAILGLVISKYWSTSYDCVAGTCETSHCVLGYCSNDCFSDADCKHDVCSNGACETVNEPGTNQCDNDEQCQHTTCNAEGVCEAIMSPGVSVCHSNADCQHTVCDSGQCTTSPTVGTDQCSTDSDCVHAECDSSTGTCETVNGAGEDACSTDADCHHNACSGESCIRVNSPGISECATDADCGSGTGGSGTGGSGTGGSGTGGSGTGGSGTGGSGTGGSGS